MRRRQQLQEQVTRGSGSSRTADELAAARALNAQLAEQLQDALSALQRTERELRDLQDRVATATPRSGIALPRQRGGCPSERPGRRPPR